LRERADTSADVSRTHRNPRQRNEWRIGASRNRRVIDRAGEYTHEEI
jgi:hypothetical protein